MQTQFPAMPSRHDHLGFRTTCGRELAVGWLTLGDDEWPARRVTLDVGHSPGRDDGTWAALTPAEARQLASALLRQAEAAEGLPEPDDHFRTEYSQRGHAQGSARHVGQA
jgi:hypothetical protein